MWVFNQRIEFGISSECQGKTQTITNNLLFNIKVFTDISATKTKFKPSL